MVIECLRKTVNETAKHEYVKKLNDGGKYPAEAVQHQRGDQHHLAALGVRQTTPEVRAEHHSWDVTTCLKLVDICKV